MCVAPNFLSDGVSVVTCSRYLMIFVLSFFTITGVSKVRPLEIPDVSVLVFF